MGQGGGEDEILAEVSETLDGFFGRWERNGVLPSLREPLEVAAMWAGATALNLRDKRRARAQVAAGYPAMRRRFEENLGHPPNLENPRSFSEKLQWRKINDRNPLFPILSDKAAAKTWITEKIGEDRTVPTLFEAESPLDLPQDIASRTCVLKVTHASSRNIFVSPTSGLTRGDILRRISRYLYRDFGVLLHEWAYDQVPRKIIAEPVLLAADGSVPGDARFHMIGGKLKFIHYNTAELLPDLHKTKGVMTNLISPEWTQMPLTRRNDKIGPMPPRPREFERMVEIAEILSAEFDYLRVDFFVIDGEFRVSETTLYSSSGVKRFEPHSYDAELGAEWVLPR